MKRSLLSVAAVALLAGLAGPAHAQRTPVPRPLATVQLVQNVPTPAYASLSTLAGVPGRTGNLDTKQQWSSFNIPQHVTTAAGGAGAIYVTDVMNASVRVILGGSVTTFASGIPVVDATGMAVDPTNEKLILTLQGNKQLFSLARGGQLEAMNNVVELLPAGVTAPFFFSSPHGIIRDDQGNFYIADWGRHAIMKMTRGGVVTLEATGPLGFGPTALARDARDGSIYAVAGSAVFRVSGGTVALYAGNPTSRGLGDGVASVAQFNDPRGIAVDGTGRVFVADAQVQADGTSRGFIRQIAMPPTSQVARPVGLPFAPQAPWVSTLGFQGSGAVAAIPVALSRPAGMTMWSNQLVVADSRQHTVDILH